MSYLYISDSKILRGGKFVAAEDLHTLPEKVINQAIKNKVIKKKNERRKESTESKEVES